jgi:septal ring factor EnvC (AmiA/AmiB activator)
MDNSELYSKTRVNENRIENLKEDLQHNQKLLAHIEDELTQLKMDTGTKLSNLSNDLSNAVSTLNVVNKKLEYEVNNIGAMNQKIEALSTKLDKGIEWTQMFTKENLGIIASLLLLLNIAVSTYNGTSTDKQIDALTEIINAN